MKIGNNRKSGYLEKNKTKQRIMVLKISKCEDNNTNSNNNHNKALNNRKNEKENYRSSNNNNNNNNNNNDLKDGQNDRLEEKETLNRTRN